MALAEIVFARSQWIPWALAFGGLLMVLSIVSVWSSRMPTGMRWLAILLRCVGIGLLLFCWLEPMASVERPKPQANTLAVVVDNSGSMRPLVESSGSASNPFQELLAEDAAWMVQATEDFRVRRYLFDSGIAPVDSFSGWTGTGASSPLRTTLRGIQERYRDQPLAGVILLSDGRTTETNTDATLGEVSDAEFQVPIFPVRIETSKLLRDLRIEQVTLRQSEFETAPVSLTAYVSHSGFGGTEAVVDLVDALGEVQSSQTLRLSDEDQPIPVEFRFRPDKSGLSSYSVIVRSQLDSSWNSSKLASDPSLTSPTEITLGNNRRYQVVDRGIGPYRILYLSGRPNWEFKFLRRALDEDAEIELTSLIRIAKKELKFSFRNPKLESTNPLFSGFEDVSDEEKEQYDEPVFARLGVKQSGELQKGFPKDAEELFEYSCIIIDDLEHEFLSLDQQQLLRQFVAVRGGSLLVLGGQESMRGSGFRDSVLGQLLPVYGDLAEIQSRVPTASESTSEEIRFQLTREGWLQPFLRLADNEADERKRIDGMPGFQVFNKTGRIKPGASVLVEGELADQSKVPILISQRFGRGRTATLAIGDFWRWALRYENDEASPLFQAWRQIVRAMIADVPKPISVRQFVDPNNARFAQLVVSVAGPDFQAIDNGSVTVEFESPDGEKSQSIAQPSTEKVGEYTTSLIMKTPGCYTASVIARGEDDNPLGTASAGWVFEPAANEFAKLGWDESYLQRLADASGGRVLQPNQLTGMAAWIPADKIPVKEVRIYPVWHSPWMIFLALTSLAMEWFLRRRYGLA